jgi:heme/copper-type cytochrome/quinol oxidase subunit 2
MAVAALVLGIIGLLFSWTVFLGIVAVLAVIFGVLGRNRAKREPAVGGGGMALAGLICGIIGVIIAVAILIIGIVATDEISNDLEELNEQIEQQQTP